MRAFVPGPDVECGSDASSAAALHTGIGNAKAEKIFYRALAAYMTSNTDFYSLRVYTLFAAADLYGLVAAGGVGEYAWVKDAWSAVGNHWEEQFAPLSAGSSWTSPSYTTTVTGRHTARLIGQGGSNYDLFLEKWNGSTWTTYESAATPSTTEVIETPATAGIFRWRVYAASGSGYSYKLYWNRW